MRLADKVAVITGAGSGIGRVTAIVTGHPLVVDGGYSAQ
jgi:NADP-dependent 3-hydroxy acid dehydrogenase YdfG